MVVESGMDRDAIERMALDTAYEQALKSLSEGGIPIGAALVNERGVIIALGHNLRVQSGDPTAHAETVCIRNAGRRRDWHMLTMATTLSPCAMCSGTAVLHRIRRVIIGENRTFQGLPLDEALAKRGAEARCGLLVVDTRTGDTVGWVRIEGVVRELYDVAVLPGVRNPAAVGFVTDEIRRVISIDQQ